MGTDQLIELAGKIGALKEFLFEKYPFFDPRSQFFEIEAAKVTLREINLLVDHESLAEQPTTTGNEHRVWVQNDSTVLKATYPNQFGFLPWGEFATPREYLERIALTNLFLGDSIKFKGGYIDAHDRLSLIITQRFIEGRNATDPEIERFFNGKGFRLQVGQSPRPFWELKTSQGRLCIGDMHTDNLLITPSGQPVVIDAIVALR